MTKLIALTAGLGNYFEASNRLTKKLKQKFDIVVNLTDLNISETISQELLTEVNLTDICNAFIWKPLFIKSVMDQLSDGDKVLYIDSGCDINLNRNFDTLLSDLDINETLIFTNRLSVREWCEPRIYDELFHDFVGRVEEIFSPAAGVLFFRKSQKVDELLSDWSKLALHENGKYHLGFNDPKHRHDQVTLAYCMQKHKIHSIDYPIFFETSFRHNEQVSSWPVHTTRNRTYCVDISRHSRLLYRVLYKGFRSKFLYLSTQKITFKIQGALVSKILQVESFLPNKFNVYKSDSSFATLGDPRPEKLIVNRPSAKIENCVVLKDGTIVVSVFGKKYLLSSYSRYFAPRVGIKAQISNYLSKYKKASVKNVRKISKATLCLNKDSDNLYHFLWDCVSNTNYKFMKKNKNNPLLLSAGLKSLKEDWLQINEFKGEFLESATHCDTLFTMDYSNYSGEPSISQIKNLQEHFVRVPHLNTKSKKFVIQRNLGRVLHLTDLQKKWLIGRGFEFIDLGKLSLIEQVNLFRNATKIIGPHGAGLSWIFMCRSDCTIIELNNSIFRNDCFRNIAVKLNINFKQINCKPAQSLEKDEDPDLVLDKFSFNKLREFL